VRITSQTPTILVIEDRPWLESLVGTLFLAGGLVAVVAGERVFGGGFITVCAAIVLLFANTVTNRFDRTAGRYTRSVKGLVRRHEAAHPLNEIAGVRVERSATGNPSTSYRVSLVLKSRAVQPLASAYSSGKDEKERIATEIKRFLGLPAGPEAGMPGFGEMIKMMRD
jgi:hypothetical protein